MPPITVPVEIPARKLSLLFSTFDTAMVCKNFRIRIVAATTLKELSNLACGAPQANIMQGPTVCERISSYDNEKMP